MKNSRQEMILSIIAGTLVETQEQLLALLRERGVKCTQATVSRDMKELHLVKEPAGQGKYRYAVSAHRTRLNFADKLQSIFRESVLSVDFAQNLVVLRTMPGLANAAAAALDGMDHTDIVGTLAGDDTVLLVMRESANAADFCAQVKEQIR